MAEGYDYVRILNQLSFSYLVNIVIFLMAPIGTLVLSRNLSVVEFGVYSLFFSFWNFGMHFGAFGLNVFMQSYLPGRALSEQEKTVGVLFRFVALAAAVFWILWFLVFGKPVLVWLKIPQYFDASLLVVGAIVVSASAIIPHVWIGVLEELNFSQLLYGVNSVGWIVLMAVEVLFTKSLVLWHVFLYWIVGGLVQFVLSLVKLGRLSVVMIKTACGLGEGCGLPRGLLFGLSLMPMVAHQWMMTAVDRVLLARFVGHESVGLYSLVYSLVGIVGSFSGIVVAILYPYVARAWNTENVKHHEFLFSAALKYVLVLVLPGVVGVFMLPEPFVSLIGGDKFLASVSLVKYFVLFPIFSSLLMLLQMVLLIQGNSLFVSGVYLGGFLVNVLVNRFVVTQFGVAGIAIGMLCAYAMMVCLLWSRARLSLSIRWDFVKLGRLVLSSIVLGIVLFFLKPMTFLETFGVIFISALVYGVCCMVVGVFGKDELSVLKNFLVRVGL